ncbi:MAG: permease [Phycisphaerae bacterium]|jgi:hypothetical protein|nr:permease [Phycisphaerae bacterium]
MNKKEIAKFAVIAAVFLGCYFLPLTALPLTGPLTEMLALVRDYARQHVLLCLVPAFFIAGGIATFISSASVMKYLGAKAHKALAYAVASVSGAVLAVCSCTVLPLFAGIYKMGAGIGPACAFLYAGPAINVLAIILTARVLGLELGIARAVGAVVFSVFIGIAMHLIYRKEERARALAAAELPDEPATRGLWQNTAVLGVMVAVLVFGNWAVSGQFLFGVACCPGPDARTINEVQGEVLDENAGSLTVRRADEDVIKIERDLLRWQDRIENPIYAGIHRARFYIAGCFLLALALMLKNWFKPSELGQWGSSTWGFAKQILPLLLIGVMVAGLLLGRGSGHEGLIPAHWVQMLVGESPDAFLGATGLAGSWADGFFRTTWPLWTNFFAAICAAFMYFATLTEVPIIEGLLRAGMGKGPALSLLLAGPALSLPNMLVIRAVMGTRKTLTYISLVVVMATLSGMIFALI